MLLVFKVIPAILLSVPMPAQSPWVAARVSHGDSGILVYAGEQSDPLYVGLQELLRADELAEMGIKFFPIQVNQPDYPSWVSELGLAQGALWAFADNTGRVLIRDNKLPNAVNLRNALVTAGVKSPIRVLRDFLRQYPDHLDARTDLLNRIRETAEARTRRTLQLNTLSPLEAMRLGTNGVEAHYRHYSLSGSIDTSPLEGRQLTLEQDIQIWGPYAQEWQTLFTSDDWRLVSLPWVPHLVPLEACSPTMIQIYRRNLAKFEDRLEEMPSNPGLWLDYGWTLSITKQNSAMALLGRLVPSPNTPLPPLTYGLGVLISGERAKGNWEFIAETLMSNWPRFHAFIYSELETIEQIKDRLREAEYWQPIADGRVEVIWRDYLNPLIESLIKTNRIAEAEKIIADVAKFHLLRNFQRRAAELALSLDRRDLQAKWLALEIPEKSDEPGMDDLEALFYLNNSPAPRLVVINKEASDIQKVSAMLGQGRLLNWRISHANLNQALLELMRQKEGWPEGVAYWALFDTKNKVIAHGSGLPTEEALHKALEQSNIETPANILRRFVREHPSHFEAKEMFLRELKRIAEQRTKEAIGADAGTDAARTLNDEDDRAIWGEYATLCRQVIPYYLNQGRSREMWFNSPCDSEYFIHSPTMKNIAYVLLPQVENALTRQPTDEFLLNTWASLSNLFENQSFRDLLESLALSPMHDPLDFPPTNFRYLLMMRFEAKSNWQGIIDVQERRWEIMRDNLELNHTPWVWPQDMQYLLEAYLRLEKNNEATELVRIWKQSPAWEQIKQSAIDLAEKCGRNALAEQWKK